MTAVGPPDCPITRFFMISVFSNLNVFRKLIIKKCVWKINDECIKTEKRAILCPVQKNKINTYPPLFSTLFAAPIETAGGVLFE